jgi:signal transduction histidine kinase
MAGQAQHNFSFKRFWAIYSRPIAFLLWLVLAALALVQLPLAGPVARLRLQRGEKPENVRRDSWIGILQLAAVTSFATAGMLVLRRRQGNRIGWLMLLMGLLNHLESFCTLYAIHGFFVAPTRRWPLHKVAGWVQHWLWVPRISLFFVFFPLFFPDGRLPSAWWRPYFWHVAVSHLVGLPGYAFAPIPLENGLLGWPKIANPFVLSLRFLTRYAQVMRLAPVLVMVPPLLALWLQNPHQPYRLLGSIGLLIASLVSLRASDLWRLAAFCLISASTLLWRWHTGSREERQQIKWITYLMALAGTSWVGANLPFLLKLPLPAQFADTLFLIYRAVLVGAPVALGFAIMKHRLYDIDQWIKRTLVYVPLTGLIISLYGALVALCNLFFQRQRRNTATTVIATGVVAVLFQPLRARIQRAVDRYIYGERDDPAGVITRLAGGLETTNLPNAVLPTLVETVAQALKLPFVAIELHSTEHSADGAMVVAAMVGERPQDVEVVAMSYQNQVIGQLIVAPRAPGEPFAPADLSLLNTIAQLAATTARTIQLTDEVQEARVRTVSAREEERRRLRRDLHDGLGPVLASQGLKLAAARQLLREKPEVAERLLDEVMSQSENTVAEVRRLVYALRPPTLDELGLVEAIREHVEVVGANAPLQIGVDAPDALPEIPAAIEVAALRVVQEALNNVIRHAQARHCTIAIAANRGLQILIEDDGLGLPADIRSGVGLRSMRERASEVGGVCKIENGAQGGVVVRLSLPLEPA